MKHILRSIIFFILILAVDSSHGQNISVNTTGAAAAATNMFEVLQPSTTINTVGIFARHSGAASNAYAIWAEATSGSNKYAIVVPTGGGQVGFGTVYPWAGLHVADNTYADIFCETASNVNSGTIAVVRSRGTIASTTAVLNGDALGWLGFLGYNGTNYNNLSAYLSADATENFTTTACGANLYFWTTPNATITPLERMVITNSGLVGIGTSAPSTLLHLAVNNAVTASTTNFLTIDHTTTGTAAAAFGSGINFNLENSTGALINSGLIENLWSAATAGSERGILSFSIRSVSGMASRLRIGSLGVAVGGTGAVTPTNILEIRQFGTGSGTPGAIVRTFPGALTNITAGTEYIDLNFDLNRTVQFLTGAITTQRAALIQAPTYAFTGASTITNAATFAISGAPVVGANATITNPYALWVQGGISKFAGRIQGTKGANVTSAATITLGNDGNFFDITGTTTITNITVANWSAGSVVVLRFNGAITITDTDAPGSGQINLNGTTTNFSAVSGSTLQLMFDGTAWYEIGRKQ